MSEEERKSIDNGIWLCGHHADLIDREEENYPAELLREWVKAHESRTEKNHNEKLLYNEEVKEKISSELFAFVKNGPKGEFVRGKESMLLKMGDDAFRELDPRLVVKTNVIDGSVHRTILPLAPEKYIPSVCLPNLNQSQAVTLQSFIENGIEEVRLENTQISIDSPLFEHLSKIQGTPKSITIFRKPALCKVRIRLRGDNNNYGDFFRRAKLFSLPGKVMITTELNDGFTNISVSISERMTSTSISFTTDFSSWDGLLLNEIENIGEVKLTMAALANTKNVNLVVQLSDGRKESLNFSMSEQQHFRNKELYIETILFLRDVSEHFNLPLVHSEGLKEIDFPMLNLIYNCSVSGGSLKHVNSGLKIRFEVRQPVEDLMKQNEFTFPLNLLIQGVAVPVDSFRITFETPVFLLDGDYLEIATGESGCLLLEILEND